jgi:hypothetical protein
MTDAVPLTSGRSRSALWLTVPAGLALAATIGLWGYYGTAVFYEMILTGLAACF